MDLAKSIAFTFEGENSDSLYQSQHNRNEEEPIYHLPASTRFHKGAAESFHFTIMLRL